MNTYPSNDSLPSYRDLFGMEGPLAPFLPLMGDSLLSSSGWMVASFSLLERDFELPEIHTTQLLLNQKIALAP